MVTRPNLPSKVVNRIMSTEVEPRAGAVPFISYDCSRPLSSTLANCSLSLNAAPQGIPSNPFGSFTMGTAPDTDAAKLRPVHTIQVRTSRYILDVTRLFCRIGDLIIESWRERPAVDEDKSALCTGLIG